MALAHPTLPELIHRFREQAPTGFCARLRASAQRRTSVGASLLAMALAHSILPELIHRFREQARSHSFCARLKASAQRRASVGANLLAIALAH
jgi:hypothetical protein